MTDRPATSHSGLPLWIAGVCIAVIVYVSLQPFSGWTEPAPGGRFFLFQWGQRWTVGDASFNVLAYIPFGFALVMAWPLRWSGMRAIVATLGSALVLSLAMETAQIWLPTRYASVLDTAANLAGTFVGSVFGALVIASRTLLNAARSWRETLVVHGDSGDLKLVLLLVWLLAQTNPAIPLFGATFHPGQKAAFEPVVLVVELVQTASALIGIGLFTDLMMRKRWMGGIALVLVITLAIVMKTAAAQAVLTPVAWDEWLRPGHTLGLAVGAFALMVLFWLPRAAKSVIAGIALLSSVMVTLLLPDFVAAKAPLSIFSWTYGHLLHLNGLTHTIVILWPFLATAVLLWRFTLRPSHKGMDVQTEVGSA
jgi:VanZ family protein